MRVLVCGGAGYIGSHTVKCLEKSGYDVLVLDNLVKGHLPAIGKTPFVHADLTDRQSLERVFGEYKIRAVMHFAAYSLVGESTVRPDMYYHNNVTGTFNLLEAMRRAGVDIMVFSSTAAVYGEPVEVPVREEHPTVPTNPYGATKLAVEEMLRWYGRAYGLKYISLRYFNAAGADPSGEIGEDHRPESHLIPLVLQAALGTRAGIKVFGTDYPTPDGTCIRDYVHVNDLAGAHVLAMEKLARGGQSGVYNLGNGNGFSVREVIETARKVTGRSIQTTPSGRRPGDPAVLVASAGKARRELGWEPRYTSLEDIIATAWNWHRRHPEGFE